MTLTASTSVVGLRQGGERRDARRRQPEVGWAPARLLAVEQVVHLDTEHHRQLAGAHGVACLLGRGDDAEPAEPGAAGQAIDEALELPRLAQLIHDVKHRVFADWPRCRTRRLQRGLAQRLDVRRKQRGRAQAAAPRALQPDVVGLLVGGAGPLRPAREVGRAELRARAIAGAVARGVVQEPVVGIPVDGDVGAGESAAFTSGAWSATKLPFASTGAGAPARFLPPCAW